MQLEGLDNIRDVRLCVEIYESTPEILLNDNIYADKTFQWYNIWILKRPYWSKPQTGVINCRIETRKGS